MMFTRQGLFVISASETREEVAYGCNKDESDSDVKLMKVIRQMFPLFTHAKTDVRHGFYVHDPLWPSDLGSCREWPETALCEALAGAGPYSINQGVIVRSEREILAPTVAEFGQVANESLSNIVLLGYLSDIYRALGIVAGNINARQGLALAEIVRLKRK